MKTSPQEPIRRKFLNEKYGEFLCVCLLAVLVFFPFAISLSPDEEDYFVAVLSTVLHARALHEGIYSFWNSFSGFGMPHPFSQHLIYHPFLFLSMLLPVEDAICVTYFAHILIALASLWFLCINLKIHRWVRFVCLLTYALSPTALSYLFVDFWITCMTVWSLLPLLLWVAVKFVQTEAHLHSYCYAVAFGLLFGWLFLNSHASVAGYALFGIGFFLLGNPSQILKKIKPLIVTAIVITLISGSKIYDIITEWLRFPATDPRMSQTMPMDWWALLMWPLTNPFTGNQPFYRVMTLGGLFLVLACIGMIWRRIDHPAKKFLTAGFLGCFAVYFLPVKYFKFLSANYTSRDCWILFGVLLAGMALTELSTRMPHYRPIWITVGVLQLILMSAGAGPYLWSNVDAGARYYRGKPAYILRNAVNTKPFIEFVKERSLQREGRLFLSPEAEKLMFRNLTNTHFATFSLNNIRIVNGYFKGIDYHQFFPNLWLMVGQVRATPQILANKQMMDVLNIRYIFATPGEAFPSELRMIGKFTLYKGKEVLLLENEEAWPDVVSLATTPSYSVLAPPDDRQGVLAQDFSALKLMRDDRFVRVHRDRGGGVSMEFAPSDRPLTFFVSEHFRPEWQASFYDAAGRSHQLNVFPIFTTFIGIEIPPHVDEVHLRYVPFWRAFFAGLSWVMLICGSVFLFLSRKRLLQSSSRVNSGNTT